MMDEKKCLMVSVLLLLSSSFAVCQMNSSLDFIIGIDYTYRVLNNTGDDEIFKIISNQREKESGKINWRLGINYNRQISSKLTIKSGLRLAAIGYKGDKKTNLRWPSEHDEMGNWVPDPNLPHDLQINKEFWFFEFPLILRYEFNKKKINPFVEIGISPALYITSRSKVINEFQTTKRFYKEDLSSFSFLQFIGNISFGINYRIDSKFELYGQSIYRYHLSSLYKSPIREHLYNIGFEFGLRRNLNNAEE